MGTVVVCLFSYPSWPALLLIGGCLAGFGFVLLLSQWEEALSGFDAFVIESMIPTAFVLSVPVYAPLILFKGTFAVVVTMLLPLLSLFFLLRGDSEQRGPSQKGQGPPLLPFMGQGGRSAASGTFPTTLRQFPGMWETGVVLLAFWFCFGLFRVYVAPCYPSGGFPHYLVAFTVALFLALALLVLSLFRERSINISVAYKWALPFMCLGYALLLLLGEQRKEIPYTVVFFCLLNLQLFVFVSVAKYAGRNNVDARFVLAVLFGLIGAGAFLGTLLGFAGRALFPDQVLTTAMPLLVTVLVSVVMALGRRSERFHALRAPVPRKAVYTDAALGGNGGRAQVKNWTQIHDLVVCAQAAVVAERYSLSERECEILRFLISGYSRSSIRDELVISLNTVNTHVRRIYTKLDIHSHQELIGIVREMQPKG
ncbi:MAG: helix-turn-helix transcriptional regulator [Coriobacteriales bacterium]|nr:helix-turn-helix transcriptional regulator [Coriobacteriales bacterium]